MNNDLPILLFATPHDMAAWLEANHALSSGIWLRIAKKGASLKSISYDQAVDEALCYGWIDGLKHAHDEVSWLQKFTPRRPNSIWSQINREKAERLIAEGRMQPAGLKAIEVSKQNGRWETAYGSRQTIEVPADFQAELDKNPLASAHFATLNGANRFAILIRIQTARRTETRLKRIAEFIRKLENQDNIYP